MIELWFEKNWELPEDVVMIPEEQAAIVTFRDPKGSPHFLWFFVHNVKL